jgi:ectoine hydroxylase-related dioxygenase (phytanoyl-CoA dioxygenase family)
MKHVSINASLPRVGADAPAEQVLETLRNEGAVVVERLLSRTAVAAFRADLNPWFERACTGSGAFFGRKTRRFGGLFAKAPSTARLALDPLVLSVMDQLLAGPSPERRVCDSIELNLTQAIGIEPGEPPQFLHRDEELWPFQHDFELMANAMWMLDDFTAENGATRVIPGSHLWPRDRQPQPGEAVAATGPAGSVLLWTGGLLHAGGENRTDRIRRGVVMSYKLGWLQPGERLLLSTPPAVARCLPERLQRLIGYGLHRPNLGWVEGRDPLEWLTGDFDDLAPVGDNLTPEHEALLAAVEADPAQFAGYLQ